MIEFSKYQGAGNDFIMIDNRFQQVTESKVNLAKKLCSRHFGIGSDGLIFIEITNKADFLMDFYNPDGSQSFCGNGSRCAVKFAQKIGVFKKKTIKFMAIDGPHHAEINGDEVKVSMQNVNQIAKVNLDSYLDTGSPHYIVTVDDLKVIDLLKQGREIRYDKSFSPGGTNVNFIQQLDENSIAIRTYERGVENETLACGTGATAGALVFAKNNNLGSGNIGVRALGGDLKVYFDKDVDVFTNIYLEGPAKFIFNGTFSG